MDRKYILEAEKRGRKDRAVLEVRSGDAAGTHDQAVLSLPRKLPGELHADVLDALRRAYEAGREDRSAELIPGGPREDLLRSMIAHAAMDVLREQLGGWLPSAGLVQRRIALGRYDEANRVLEAAIGTEHTFPLGTYEVRVLIEEKKPR